MTFEVDGIRQVTKDELKRLLQDEKTHVIDVRTPEEYEEGHIPNVPSRPMQEIANWLPELSKTDPYVFVCRSGARSQRVAQFLVQQGFQDIANFSGGMIGWDEETEADSD